MTLCLSKRKILKYMTVCYKYFKVHCESSPTHQKIQFYLYLITVTYNGLWFCQNWVQSEYYLRLLLGILLNIASFNKI